MTPEEQVRQVYPDAVCIWHVTEGQLCGWVIFTSHMSYGVPISDLSERYKTWESALQKLTNKKQ